MKKERFREIFKNQIQNKSTFPPGLSLKVSQHLKAFLPWSEYKVVASYFPLKGEPDLGEFKNSNPHICFVYPREGKAKTGLYVWELAPSSGEEGDKAKAPWGGYQPLFSKPFCPVDTVEVFLVPGLAFDQWGGRLGRGGGVYDQILSQSSGLKIGLCFSSQVSGAKLPMDLYDQTMDALITEKKVFVFSSPLPLKERKKEV